MQKNLAIEGLFPKGNYEQEIFGHQIKRVVFSKKISTIHHLKNPYARLV